MNKIGFVLAAVLALGSFSGCKKKDGDAMAKMSEIKDHMCACKEGDKDCVAKVQKEMADYTEANKNMKDDKMSAEDVSKGTDIGMAYAKCMQKGLGAPPMGAPPPAADNGSAAAGSGSAAPAPAAGSGSATGSGSAK